MLYGKNACQAETCQVPDTTVACTLLIIRLAQGKRSSFFAQTGNASGSMKLRLSRTPNVPRFRRVRLANENLTLRTSTENEHVEEKEIYDE